MKFTPEGRRVRTSARPLEVAVSESGVGIDRRAHERADRYDRGDVRDADQGLEHDEAEARPLIDEAAKRRRRSPDDSMSV